MNLRFAVFIIAMTWWLERDPGVQVARESFSSFLELQKEEIAINQVKTLGDNPE